MSIQRHGTTRRYSDSVVHAGTVYLVEVPANLDADVTSQTENLLASVDRLLAQAGSNKSHLLMVTIYLTDMADYDAMNVVWDAWLPEGHAPTRACVQARLSHAKYRVEMALTAAVAQG
ncbi:MAG: RidA family protein [Dechloromonas sp.]|uniref:RidA family protein n=1 Tax=Dechloromonas sp. TaxID=1917218 RepID=UPI0027F8851B|nr:RidA family protein [Dechloromonas sp.]MBT9523029.1 RidA family protein [Dechloromonas sp.]